MCKNLALFLISVHLLGNTELGQLLKLPRLVSHYAQHKLEDPGTGIFQFLGLHYFDGDHANDPSHQKLPFHTSKASNTTSKYNKRVQAANSAVEIPFCYISITYPEFAIAHLAEQIPDLPLRPPQAV